MENTEQRKLNFQIRDLEFPAPNAFLPSSRPLHSKYTSPSKSPAKRRRVRGAFAFTNPVKV